VSVRGWLSHLWGDDEEVEFAPEWRAILEARYAQWQGFTDEERERLEDLIVWFVHRKRWQPAQGFQMTDAQRVLIAAMACTLILELDPDHYRLVKWIIVHRSTVVIEQPTGTGVPGVVNDSLAIDGQAEDGTGAIVLSWDAAQFEASHPEHGHNLVFHEFAHKLDMLDGRTDGTPPIADRAQLDRWVEVCTREYEAVRDGHDHGRGGGILRSYAGVNPAEFFAVATETLFTRPVLLRERHPDLYEVLTAFYRQDPARR
jgi:Mlc titration factor MtfA (ptsG expression regulator)